MTDWPNVLAAAVIPVLLTAVSGLLAWLARGAANLAKSQSQLGLQHAALANELSKVVARIDNLVAKIEANFAAQISEQLLRNTLQEKVRNLENQMLDLQRVVRRRPVIEEDPNA